VIVLKSANLSLQFPLPTFLFVANKSAEFVEVCGNLLSGIVDKTLEVIGDCRIIFFKKPKMSGFSGSSPGPAEHVVRNIRENDAEFRVNYR
jgi:hypothetical protein